MADIANLVNQIAEQLGGQAQAEEDGTYTLQILDEGEPVALVTCYAETIEDGPAKGSDVFMLRAAAGELAESIQLYLVEEASTTWFARAYLEEEEEEAGPVIIIEAGLPLNGLDVNVACHAVLEVVDLAVNAQDFVVVEEDEEA